VRGARIRPLLVAALTAGGLLLPAAAASVPAPPSSLQPSDSARPSLRVFTDQDGLPQNAVSCLTVDREGYLWAGTQDGAAYYNGRAWRIVHMPHRATSNWVKRILACGDGSHWFATDGGVAILRQGAWTTYGSRDGLPDEDVEALIEAANGDIWAGTKRGVARWRNGEWVSVGTADEVRCLTESEAGGTRSVWAGTPRGLFRQTGDGALEAVPIPVVPVGTGVWAMLASHDEYGSAVLWVATPLGLARYSSGGWSFQSPQDGVPAGGISDLAESVAPDGRRTLWAASYHGLGRYSAGRWRVFHRADGLPLETLWSLCVTPLTGTASVLWIGSAGAGLVQLQLAQWWSFNELSGLPANSTYAIVEDEDNAIWVGTVGGLARLDATGWKEFGTRDGLPDPFVLCLLAARHGDGTPGIWVGTYNGGLARPRSGGWSVVDAGSGLPGNRVSCLAEVATSDGSWVVAVGTNRGLALLENGKWTILDSRSGLPHQVITCLEPTQPVRGRFAIWVGTRAGLVRYEDGAGFERFDMEGDLAGSGVQSVHEISGAAHARWLWVGTQAAGLARLDLRSGGRVWQVFSESSTPALRNNVVYRVFTDSAGRLYASTNSGVARLTPGHGGDVSDFHVRSYTTRDGLPSNECNSGASYVDSRGRLWVGTIAGLAVFDPALEPADRNAPLRLERIEQLETGRALGPNPSLRYDEASIGFDFALLEYAASADTVYRTQLVGLDSAMSEWSSDAKKEYTHLPSGNFVFKVWARDASGRVYGPAEFAFMVHGAPWLSWWAYLLYVTALAAAIVAGIRVRERTHRRRTAELERRIEERTAQLTETVEQLVVSEQRAREASRAKSAFLASMSHELRTPLNAILGFIQVMERRPGRDDQDREHLTIMNRSGEHLLSLIDDVLSVAKIESGKVQLQSEVFELRGLLTFMEQLFRAKAAAKGLAFAVRIGASIPSVVVGDEPKLRQVLINLVGNAIKFTEQGHVALDASWNDGVATFVVEDSGRGIAPGEMEAVFAAFEQTASGQHSGEGTGLGLAISKGFVELMGGRIEVSSTPGAGSRFDVTVPLEAAADRRVLAEPKRVVGANHAGSPARMLIVDDHAENRLVLTGLLSPLGFELREASGGEEALAIWRKWRPRLIWLDLRMPGIDGLEVARRLRAEEQAAGETQPCLIVAVTASAFEQDRAQLLDSGCDRIVSKPFSADAIFEVAGELDGVTLIVETQPQPEAGHGGLSGLLELSNELRAQLRLAAVRGNSRQALEAIERVRQTDPGLAAALEALVNDFGFRQIVAALDGNDVA
jgi:signal transduction histidine kinase/ActR/RegA family two-component response regulator